MSTNFKPSHEEEEFIARQEIEKRQELAEKVKADMATAELEKLKQLHWHRCSNCGFEMHAIVYKGLTIEKCPNCNGIFLEAGELERIAGKESGFFYNVLDLFKF
ncbi:MAG TPA: zf-TFIIB domain-containing protein [bacterium]|nr:zf-TFIIB domain-containing protein [bacterium]